MSSLWAGCQLSRRRSCTVHASKGDGGEGMWGVGVKNPATNYQKGRWKIHPIWDADESVKTFYLLWQQYRKCLSSRHAPMLISQPVHFSSQLKFCTSALPTPSLSSPLLSSQVNTHFKTFAALICKAGLSLCKRDAFRAHRRAHAPSLNLLLPPPPLTGEWQLFKCKLSLTNTTSRDTCFNHGNKGAASGRAGAPSPCDIQMTGRCGKQKQQHQRIDCAGEGNALLQREPPTAPVNQLHF